MEQNKEIMIHVRNVKKKYRLGQIGGGTLRGDLQSWWARKWYAARRSAELVGPQTRQGGSQHPHWHRSAAHRHHLHGAQWPEL